MVAVVTAAVDSVDDDDDDDDDEVGARASPVNDSCGCGAADGGGVTPNT